MKAEGEDSGIAEPRVGVPAARSRLSACDVVWRMQREFYQERGAEAWRKAVPWYITNNPAIANAYAELIARFLQDLKRLAQHRPLEPVYIIECGCGTGLFAYYLLNRLAARLRELQLDQMAVVYVMADVSEKNVAFWESHPALVPLSRDGRLDFAVWDVESELHLTLRRSGRVFSMADASTHTGNPVILLANYLFDTLRHDVFRVVDRQLQEGLVLLKSNEAAACGPEPQGADDALRLSQFGMDYAFAPAPLPYYGNPRFDAVLAHYTRSQEGDTFLFPLGALRCIEAWRAVACDRLIVLATDKAVCRPIEFGDRDGPQPVMHDECFSLTTNFHAIGLYCLEADGFVRHQATQQAIATSLFGIGFDLGQAIETATAFNTAIDLFGPGHLFSVYRALEQSYAAMPIEILVAYLRLLQNDPFVLDFCMDVILQRMKQTNAVVIRDLIDIMHLTAGNFYNFPGRSDTLACVGIFFQELGDLETALHYYEKSLEYFGRTVTALYNSGLCWQRMNQPDRALALFREAVALAPDNILARGWIHRLSEAASSDL
jgi:tetratricopeptide (TPR) repeat protein